MKKANKIIFIFVILIIVLFDFIFIFSKKENYSYSCRKRAEEYFDKDLCFEKYIQLYQDMLH